MRVEEEILEEVVTRGTMEHMFKKPKMDKSWEKRNKVESGGAQGRPVWEAN